MRTRRAAALLATTTAITIGFTTPAAQAAKHPAGRDIRAGAAHGQAAVHAAHPASNTRHTPNMTRHGGGIMVNSDVTPIFWGTSWASYVGDKETGLASFYAGYSGSNYAKTSDEYAGNNGQVGPSLTLRT